jgi:hypothetical protein
VYEKTYAMDGESGFIREHCISNDEFMPNEAATSRTNSRPPLDITPHSMTEM